MTKNHLSHKENSKFILFTYLILKLLFSVQRRQRKTRFKLPGNTSKARSRYWDIPAVACHHDLLATVVSSEQARHLFFNWLVPSRGGNAQLCRALGPLYLLPLKPQNFFTYRSAAGLWVQVPTPATTLKPGGRAPGFSGRGILDVLHSHPSGLFVP